MSHFKETVKIKTQNKLENLRDIFADDFMDYRLTEFYGCQNKDDISGIGYSGFCPFQDGGYEVTDLYSNSTDSSYHLSEEQTKTTNEFYDNMRNSFAEENNLPINFDYDDLTEDLQNSLSDYESEWIEPAMFKFRCWIKDGEVFADIGINYRDAPYYRDSTFETLAEYNATEKEFLKLDNETICKDLIEKAKKHE